MNIITIYIKPKPDLNHTKLDIYPINYVVNKGITFNCKFLNNIGNEVDNRTFIMDKIDWDNWPANNNDVEYISNLVMSYFQLEYSDK